MPLNNIYLGNQIPLVSVVIPCYNQGLFLSECIQSLQVQTYLNWEAIIVNDGSSDDTEKIAGEICHADTRVRCMSKINGGLSSARNAGLTMVDGEFIQFLDADDLLLPQKFERHIKAIVVSEKQMITYSDYFHGASDSPMVRVDAGRLSNIFLFQYPLLDIASRWEHDFSIPIHAALFPAWLFRDHQIRFDESLPNHEDWDFWMQVMSFVEEVNFIPEELAIYRFSDNSMSRNKYNMWYGFNSAIEKQRSRFVADRDVLKALNFLMKMNNYNHGYGFKGYIRSLINHGSFDAWPWPLQKKLRSLSNPPKNPMICEKT